MDCVKTPKVSVRLPAYNHVKYIRECMESVLNQTFEDFEFVITDDGSTDGTAEIIKEYNDPRIRLVVLEKNRGSASAIENAAGRARGEYIANICSDDAWEPDKLEKQVYFLENNRGYDAAFTRVQLIGEDSEPYTDDEDLYSHIFEQPNRTKDEWLHYFFCCGNCLCIPSVMIKKKVYESLGYQDKRMANLNDFDLWVRFCMSHELFILGEKLTKFRIRANKANASANRIENQIRGSFENKQIMEHFLQIAGSDRLLCIFPECGRYGVPEDGFIPYFLGRLALETGVDFKQLWGLEVIFKFMEDSGRAKALEEKYGFSFIDFYKLTQSMDVFKLQEMSRLNMIVSEQNKEILRLKKTSNEQSTHIQNIESQKDILINEIKKMQKTVSWKLTSPLRKALILKKNLKAKLKGQNND